MVLSYADMQNVSLEEIQRYAKASKDALWEAAREYGRDVKIYLHWTAGRYGQFWDDYHLQIDEDGICYMPNNITLCDKIAGTYMRNSGSVAVAILGCFDATTNKGLGTNPPTLAQIETMARVIAVIAEALEFPIDIKHVMTHGEAADNEDGYLPEYQANGYPDGMYGPKHSVERWDLEYLGTKECPSYQPYATNGCRGGDILRGKAKWYHHEYDGEVEKYF